MHRFPPCARAHKALSPQVISEWLQPFKSYKDWVIRRVHQDVCYVVCTFEIEAQQSTLFIACCIMVTFFCRLEEPLPWLEEPLPWLESDLHCWICHCNSWRNHTIGSRHFHGLDATVISRNAYVCKGTVCIQEDAAAFRRWADRRHLNDKRFTRAYFVQLIQMNCTGCNVGFRSAHKGGVDVFFKPCFGVGPIVCTYFPSIVRRFAAATLFVHS